MVTWVWGLITAGGAVGGNNPWAERFGASGWIEAVQSVRVRSPQDTLVSRLGARLKLSADFDDFFGYLAVDVEKNWKISGETGTDLHEGWLEYIGDGWDARIGRQVIIWGKADGVRITDIISPSDYTEYITRDLEEIRMPVDAARFRLLGDRIDTELIWIPFFRATVRPEGDNPWAVSPDVPESVRVSVVPAAEPGSSLKNSEIALKISGFFSGLDVAASVFHTWDDDPAMHRTVTRDDAETRVCYSPEHHRLTVFGLEFSRPWSDFVFRGEAAYYRGQYFEPEKLSDIPVRKDALRWLFGADWTPGDDWTVIAQLTGTAIFDYDSCLSDDRHSLTATLNISRELFRQTVTLSNMVYCNLVGQDLLDRFEAEYAVTDDFHLLAGADLFWGRQDESFGRYRNNSQIWFEAKYSF